MTSVFNGYNKPLSSDYKSSIMERALASDEDEYDDTYDGAYATNGQDDHGLTDDDEVIVKGSKNTGVSQGITAFTADPTLVHEPTLLQLYTSNPTLFDRSAQSRKSVERTRLRDSTGLSNEQIEGWAIQLARNVSVPISVAVAVAFVDGFFLPVVAFSVCACVPCGGLGTNKTKQQSKARQKARNQRVQKK